MTMIDWISTKDHLPEVGEMVLTFCKYGHVRDRKLYRFRSGLVCFEPDGLFPNKDILYWAPMPPLPLRR